MWFRLPLPLLAATALSAALVVTLSAQQVPNPVLPGPSGTGDGLTRDALEAPETPKPAVTADTAPQHATARRNSTQRRTATATAEGTKRSATYATISHRHRRHRAKAQFSATAYASRSDIRVRKPARPRAPLVSFIYWWNGWVMRTFHTRSGTVLLDSVGAKS